MRVPSIAPSSDPENTCEHGGLRAALAANLRAARLARGWTQETCAARCGIDRTHVQLIEARRANPTLATLELLCGGLGVAIAALFAPPATPFAPRRPGRPPRRASAERATSACRR